MTPFYTLYARKERCDREQVWSETSFCIIPLGEYADLSVERRKDGRSLLVALVTTDKGVLASTRSLDKHGAEDGRPDLKAKSATQEEALLKLFTVVCALTRHEPLHGFVGELVIAALFDSSKAAA